MKLRRLLQAGAVVQIARYAMNRRRTIVARRQRRKAGYVVAGLAGVGVALWLYRMRQEDTPAWIPKKKRKEARREAARLERERPVARPAEVHVERDASTNLRVPLNEQLK